MGMDSLEDACERTDEQGELHMISQAAVAGSEAPNTFRLLGQIQKKPVTMLVDSGSSHCFVSESVAAKLNGVQRAMNPVKVLPLGGYDVIIGMDWLEAHNPMGVDWVGKRLAFWDDGRLVQLKGLQSQPVFCKEVAPRELLLMIQQAGVTKMVQVQCMEEVSDKETVSEAIEMVLQEFGSVFAEPTELPPARQFDHAIPLIEGAKPVNLRPYRYSPEQKDEIEKQVAQMLSQVQKEWQQIPKNIVAVLKWESPKSVKEVRGFLGLAGYYRKFVRNFGQISRPLTELLRKDSEFVWTERKDKAFRDLQQALVTAPVLAIPDFNKPFVVETDASYGGVGAVLSQEGHPISYLSRALGPRNLGLSAYEKEFLDILLAVDHWRPYLQVQEFLIQSDHQSLASLMSSDCILHGNARRSPHYWVSAIKLFTDLVVRMLRQMLFRAILREQNWRRSPLEFLAGWKQFEVAMRQMTKSANCGARFSKEIREPVNFRKAMA
uniref:Uncharacterized protein n=1 Tax=Avena sativa TaxID=4498 RepID=A0ACD5TW14_AVESA